MTGALRGASERRSHWSSAGEGAKVAINYASSDAKAQAVVDEIVEKGGEAILAKANLADAAEARAMVAKAIEQFGGLDILGQQCRHYTRDRSIKKLTDEAWREVIETNLNGYFYCTSAVLPAMLEKKSFGRIVNISSMNGQVGAFGQANYSAAKGGIIAFTRTAALELAKSGITVNTVAPGFTDTDMFAEVPDNIQSQIKERIPMGRFGKPEEIAKAVLFLITDGDYVTGQQINVNGGAYM